MSVESESNAMFPGVGRGKERCGTRGSPRRGRKGVLEHCGLFAQAADKGRGIGLVPVYPQGIGSEGVEQDDNDVGRWAWRQRITGQAPEQNQYPEFGWDSHSSHLVPSGPEKFTTD